MVIVPSICLKWVNYNRKLSRPGENHPHILCWCFCQHVSCSFIGSKCTSSPSNRTLSPSLKQGYFSCDARIDRCTPFTRCEGYITRRREEIMTTHGKHHKNTTDREERWPQMHPLSTSQCNLRTQKWPSSWISACESLRCHKFTQVDSLVFAAGILYCNFKCFCCFVYPPEDQQRKKELSASVTWQLMHFAISPVMSPGGAKQVTRVGDVIYSVTVVNINKIKLEKPPPACSNTQSVINNATLRRVSAAAYEFSPLTISI